MWEVYKQIVSSDTAAQAEIDGLSEQIRETMTQAQQQSITAMKLSERDVFAVMQQGQGGTDRAHGAHQWRQQTNGSRAATAHWWKQLLRRRRTARWPEFGGGGFGGGGGFPGGGTSNGARRGRPARRARRRG